MSSPEVGTTTLTVELAVLAPSVAVMVSVETTVASRKLKLAAS